jgi:hypothetical protein
VTARETHPRPQWRSAFSPGPAPKRGTTKIEAAGAGAKVVVGNNPDADTAARTRVNATMVETISTNAGKVVTTQQSAVSADGNPRAVTTKGVSAAGKTMNNAAVYERQ